MRMECSDLIHVGIQGDIYGQSFEIIFSSLVYCFYVPVFSFVCKKAF